MTHAAILCILRQAEESNHIDLIIANVAGIPLNALNGAFAM
jgi:hypothetical protein